MKDSNQLIELLKGHKVYLQTHNFPDPDALASAFGLQNFLKYYGINSLICYDGKIEKVSTKKMLTAFGIEAFPKDEITDMTSDDYIITVDGQKHNANFTDLPGDEVACIDHHPTFIECEYKYSDIRITGACASIVTEYYINAGVPLDTNTATALLYGLKMDTASFERGVTDFDIDIFKYLHNICDKELLKTVHNNSMELDDLKAYGAAIENIRVYDNFGFVYIPFDCNDALVAMISDFILALDVVEVSVVYATRDGGLKFSVRSEQSSLHAGKLISNALSDYGNGGGHASMSGGVIPADNMDKLGKYRDLTIQNLFLKNIENATK
ncbi:MAG: DHH family phosphoesterase [Lachnospiraceae bacterium]|nr:DHH family phosphoesterase [Lachnospiraceae bacterium]MBQ4068271.1 DHH family phosphoesterase [Lachnospiraceae bacterium]